MGDDGDDDGLGIYDHLSTSRPAMPALLWWIAVVLVVIAALAILDMVYAGAGARP